MLPHASLKSILKYFILSWVVIINLISFVHAKPIELNGWVNTQTKKSFSINKDIKNYTNMIGVQAVKRYNNFTSNVTFRLTQKKALSFDDTFIEYRNKNKVLGFGKIDRNWSFSPNTSLILSKNARPSDAIYFLYNKENKPNNTNLSWIKPLSFEIFNSLLSNPSGIQNSMLLGMRAVFKPIHNLEFELVKTSQWGGDGNAKDLSSLSAATFGNTNENKNSYINQLAGFGFSYLYPFKTQSLKTYAQLIGEDEAGNLPSCFMSLVGSEMKFKKNKWFQKIGIEYADTRIDSTRSGNCGANTAYNNSTFQYTNYGVTMGVPIDSESKYLNIWATTIFSETIDINYSISKVTINDFFYSGHRLDSSKKSGWVSDIETSWKLNALNIAGRITYQSFDLDKFNTKNGFSLNLNTAYTF